MRLFVALWPPGQVAGLLEGLERPDHPLVRWTSRDQWHVTLRFLGDVDDDELPAVSEAMAAAGERPAREATLGPASVRLGRHALVVPVAGVDDLAAAVAAATGSLGTPPEERPFSGHLTLARARGHAAVPGRLAGAAVEARWPVTEVALVRSRLGGGGARYETIATVALQGSGARG